MKSKRCWYWCVGRETLRPCGSCQLAAAATRAWTCVRLRVGGEGRL